MRCADAQCCKQTQRLNQSSLAQAKFSIVVVALTCGIKKKSTGEPREKRSGTAGRGEGVPVCAPGSLPHLSAGCPWRL